jgi:DNA-binding response OmpR family regulator
MDLLAVYPDPAAPELARTLDLGGYRWKAVGSIDEAAEHEPADGWAGVLVVLGDELENTWAFCRAVRKRDTGTRVLVLVPGGQISALELRDELFDDFCLTPFHPIELEARLRHLLSSTTSEARPQMVEYSGLVLNLETYQASIDGRPLDLTYMEYELLKFLAHNPGKVFTREVLLSRVWGYEYYGGARTVDVHIRRLRAKHTVRSVGYRFGQSRWGS